MDRRGTAEWQAIETAIANFINATVDDDEPLTMVTDFIIVCARVPVDDSDGIGGYSVLPSSNMPHISQGLLAQASYVLAEATNGASYG